MAAEESKTSSQAAAVRPGLFIGGIGSWESINVTHILSLGTDIPAEDYPPGVVHSSIELVDDESANLLQHLESCCSFIAEGMASGSESAVLVHCHAGVSRSAAAVVAYLAKQEGTGISATLASLREVYPAADPNDGFMEQLLLFQHMGCKLDPNNEAYKRFSLQQLGRQWEQEGYVEGDQLVELGDETSLASMERYRCRKCRNVVASSRHVIPLEEGPGQGAFPFHKRVKDKGGPPLGKETSLFLEPLRWMETEIMQASGKLYCPSCQERLGSFNWAGIQSNSGRWVTPGFQIHLSKLDVLSPALDLKLQGAIRQPYSDVRAAANPQPSGTEGPAP